MCVQPFGWCQPMRVDGCVFSRLAGVNLCVLTDVCSAWCQPMRVDGGVFRTGCTYSCSTHGRHDMIMAGICMPT